MMLDSEIYEEAMADEAAYQAGFREYETRVITAICDCCGIETDGTSQQLIRRGWLLGKHEQICLMHD